MRAFRERHIIDLQGTVRSGFRPSDNLGAHVDVFLDRLALPDRRHWLVELFRKRCFSPPCRQRAEVAELQDVTHLSRSIRIYIVDVSEPRGRVDIRVGVGRGRYRDNEAKGRILAESCRARRSGRAGGASARPLAAAIVHVAQGGAHGPAELADRRSAVVRLRLRQA